MTAHKVEVTLSEDGELELRNLPFRAGEHVEIIILVADNRVTSRATSDAERFPLRGRQPYQFDDPFTPAVPEEDWDALK